MRKNHLTHVFLDNGLFKMDSTYPDSHISSIYYEYTLIAAITDKVHGVKWFSKSHNLLSGLRRISEQLDNLSHKQVN
jgi:hypothetical protein